MFLASVASGQSWRKRARSARATSTDPSRAASKVGGVLVTIALGLLAGVAAIMAVPPILSRKHGELFRHAGMVVIAVGIIGGAVIGLATGFWNKL